MIFNMVGAGGASDLSSIIATVESGSIVTCIKGATTLTGTSDGTVRFDDLENGTWTLKATKNGMSTMTTVNITKFQIYYITMSYFTATIAVTYPAGSTCTCTKGNTVLTAPDTSGSHTFVVPEAGEWTVTAVRDGKSKSETVTISEAAAYSITITYELVLFDNGVDNTEVTGGWIKTGDGGSVDFGETSMTVYANTYQRHTNVRPQNKISLRGIKTVIFDVDSDTTWATGYPRVGISEKEDLSSVDDGKYAAYANLSEGRREVKVDASGLNGDYYIYIGGNQGDAGPATITIYKVWGEPV